VRVVDPTFGPKLRELRLARGLSLSKLSALAYVSKAQLSQWENGGRRPTRGSAMILDRALETGGELAGLITETPDDTDAAGRIARALSGSSLIGSSDVEALRDTLATSRRLDDSLPASALLPTVDGLLSTIQAVARDARGTVARDVHLVAVQAGQFAGWLHANVRNDRRAEQLLSTAARDALSLDHPDLACQTLSFRGALDWFRGNANGMARWNLAAYEVPNASALHRADAAFNAVHAIGVLGNDQEATRLLGKADDITTALDGTDAYSPVAYWLTPGWLRLSVGLAHLGLGNHRQAADSLRAGLDGWQGADWATDYQDALTKAEAGQASA